MHDVTPGKSASDCKTTAAFAAWPYRLGIFFYKFAASAFFKCGGLSWLRKKYKIGLEERMGEFSGKPKNAIWVYGASVGEVQPALSLIETAKNASALPCILSTTTTTGRTMAESFSSLQKASSKADCMIYNPWDAPRFVKRALDTLEPRAYVAVETERWPNMLAEIHARKIPAFLLNGRLSEKSLGRLLRQRSFWRGVLCCFTRLMVRFESDKEKFLQLGVPDEKIVVTGDCKVDAMLRRKAEVNSTKWAHLRREAPLFLAGSTHKGEEETVLEGFAKVRRVNPGARLIIAPRYPERAISVVAAALPYGKVDLFTDIRPDWDIMVVNKIGVLFELYAAVDAAFIGGSLIPRGGQNPMEPALFEIQVTHGPHMFNFPDAARMNDTGAALVVRDADELADAWLCVMDPEKRELTRQASRKYFASAGGAVQRSWDVIMPYV